MALMTTHLNFFRIFSSSFLPYPFPCSGPWVQKSKMVMMFSLVLMYARAVVRAWEGLSLSHHTCSEVLNCWFIPVSASR